MIFNLWITAILIGMSIASYVLVKLLIANSHRVGLIDNPNVRSSHTIPTPRGGGVAFVVTFLASATVFGFVSGDSNLRILALAILPPGLMVAVLGFLDDKFSLRASTRLLVQTVATLISLAVLFLNWRKTNDASSINYVYVIASLAFSFFWIVWMTNLFNFMDGIDGYAALESVLVSLGLAVITFYNGLNEPALFCAMFAAAVVGFLVLNWSPAKIFMGDAGSTFLGFFFAVMGVGLQTQYAVPIDVTLILAGTFIIDSTYTLIVRVTRGQRAHVAHRDHAYQHAVQRGWSHRNTTLTFCGITAFWLLPLATLVGLNSFDWFTRVGVLTAAYLPLIVLQIKFRAGVEGA